MIFNKKNNFTDNIIKNYYESGLYRRVDASAYKTFPDEIEALINLFYIDKRLFELIYNNDRYKKIKEKINSVNYIDICYNFNNIVLCDTGKLPSYRSYDLRKVINKIIPQINFDKIDNDKWVLKFVTDNNNIRMCKSCGAIDGCDCVDLKIISSDQLIEILNSIEKENHKYCYNRGFHLEGQTYADITYKDINGRLHDSYDFYKEIIKSYILNNDNYENNTEIFDLFISDFDNIYTQATHLYKARGKLHKLKQIKTKETELVFVDEILLGDVCGSQYGYSYTKYINKGKNNWVGPEGVKAKDKKRLTNDGIIEIISDFEDIHKWQLESDFSLEQSFKIKSLTIAMMSAIYKKDLLKDPLFEYEKYRYSKDEEENNLLNKVYLNQEPNGVVLYKDLRTNFKYEKLWYNTFILDEANLNIIKITHPEIAKDMTKIQKELSGEKSLDTLIREATVASK